MWWIALIISALIALLPASIAQRKGRSFGAWYIYGFLLWIIAIFHAISLPELAEENHDLDDKIVRKSVTPNIKMQKIDLNAPIEIINYEIVVDQNLNAGFNISFRNLNIGVVTAVKFEVIGLNSFNEIIQINEKDSFISMIQDLNVYQGNTYESDIPISLPSKDIRKLEISVKQVCFSDGIIINNDSPNFVTPTYEEINNDDQIEMAQSIMRSSICYPKQDHNYWICACGRPNINSKDTCVKCGSVKDFIFSNLNRESLLSKIEFENLKNQQIEDQRKALQREQKILKSKKYKKIVQTSLILFFSIGIPLALTNYIIVPSYKYHKAQNLISQDQFNQAKEIFVSLQDYKDSPVWINECNYQEAIYEQNNSNFDYAIEIFSLLNNYKDSLAQIDESHYLKGKYNMQLKQYEKAINEFKTVINYKDSLNLINDSYFKFAQECMDKKEYLKACESLDAIPTTYKNQPELFQEARYQLGKERIKTTDYEGAYKCFSKLSSENFKDSKDLYLENSYLLVKQKISKKDYNEAKYYIKPLLDIDYKDSNSLYKEIIKWRFEGGMCSSATSNNRPAQIKNSFSKFDDFIVAGVITGGKVDEKINLSVIMTFPGGLTKSDIMTGLGDNWSMAKGWNFTNPIYAQSGKAHTVLKNSFTGEIIAEYDFYIR